ncbi:MAG: class I SAM-dependent methyltransferase [Candidatus Gracilibacteria bacterium]|jgi:2-polyprenyl-3-methyl-5-hydroxy-6-metoxy-1,4-benzoquinol methylase
MLTEFLIKFGPSKKINEAFDKWRAKDIVDNHVLPYLKPNESILDIGSGGGHICLNLKEKGFRVTPIDISNKSVAHSISPIIYNGLKVPFQNKKFDVALICTVLHHAKDPGQILKEAKRTAKRIIIIEDIYENQAHKYLTYVADSLLNLEFIGHPHNNKNDNEWKKIFEKMDLKILNTEYYKSLVVFKHAVYHLQA